MTAADFEIYLGIFFATLITVACLYLFVRMIMSGDKKQQPLVMAVLGLAMIAGLILVGNTPVVSLLVSSIVCLACLYALFKVATGPEPSPGVVGVLATAMIVSLLLTQAARTFNFGLASWFEVSVSDRREINSLIDAAQNLEDQAARALRDIEDFENIGEAAELLNTSAEDLNEARAEMQKLLTSNAQLSDGLKIIASEIERLQAEIELVDSKKN